MSTPSFPVATVTCELTKDVIVDVILNLQELVRNWLKNRVVKPVVEEAGCQAYDKLSPCERVYWEVVFSQRESSTSYGALIILDLACCRGLEREVKH
jgi:hypothetical protein